MRQFHIDGTVPGAPWIWVFGSNLAGRHGAGAALLARQVFRARQGVGMGYTGQAYAIPTKDMNLTTIDLATIRSYVDSFTDFTKKHGNLQFYVTRVGCGLAGYSDQQIAPMFNRAINCSFAEEWKPWLDAKTAAQSNLSDGFP